MQLASSKSGKHLLEVEELLETHRLLESDMALQAEKVRAVSTAALRFADAEGRCASGGWGCCRGWMLQRFGGSKGWALCGLGASGVGFPRVLKGWALRRLGAPVVGCSEGLQWLGTG